MNTTLNATLTNNNGEMDIDEMTDEDLEYIWVRCPNRPMGKGGEWRRIPSKRFSDVSDERLEEMRKRFFSQKTQG